MRVTFCLNVEVVAPNMEEASARAAEMRNYLAVRYWASQIEVDDIEVVEEDELA